MKETEFGYINWLRKHLKYGKEILVGSGDDCAVIKLPDNNLLYATTDTIVEGIDFKRAPPEQIGYKSVAISISDLAAMGINYSRIYALISASLPKNLARPSFTHRLFKGMHSICRKFGVQIIGGDISSTKGVITITSTLLGVSKSKPIKRSGACVGDAILVTGKLGGSILGKHLSFTPRLKEAGLLSSHYKITSMIDVSDGLLGDLNHILEVSKVGAMLDELSIPVSQDACRLKGNPLQHALTDGDDFELLFTAPLDEAIRIIKERNHRFRRLTQISIIGIIQKENGIYLCDKRGNIRKVNPKGYSHF
jgi:thiamine-monophosphate kinase